VVEWSLTQQLRHNSNGSNLAQVKEEQQAMLPGNSNHRECLLKELRTGKSKRTVEELPKRRETATPLLSFSSYKPSSMTRKSMTYASTTSTFTPSSKGRCQI
jgi:hypothetical protein